MAECKFGDLGSSVFDFNLSKVKWKYAHGLFLCDREVEHLVQAREMGFLEAHCALFEDSRHRVWLRLDAGLSWSEAHCAEYDFLNKEQG